jgi:hypothetical protein
LLAVLALAWIAGASSAHAATLPPASYYGANVQPVFEPLPLFVPLADWDPLLGDDPLFATMASDGLMTARTDAAWSWVEPNAPVNGQHTYTWNVPSNPAHSLDTVVGALAAEGIRMLAVLSLPPAWAGGGKGGPTLAPAHYADYIAYAAAVAARYGPGGTFWQANQLLPPNQQLPYLPIQQFEVWNEANSSNFWAGTPNAATYAQVLVPLSAAVHTVDPTAQVLASIGWMGLQGYVSQLYSLGVKGSIQGVAFHPYAPDAPSIVGSAEQLRSTLVSSGDPNLPIYVDESGLPAATSSPGAAFAYSGPVSDAARAATLSLSGDALAHGDCNVQSDDIYSLVGDDAHPGTPGGGAEFGMFNYATDAPNITGTAIIAAEQRWRSAPSAGLVLCGSGTTPTQDLLPLGVQLTHTSPTCLSAEITYQGNPLEAAQLVLRTADGRVAPAGTNAYGQTQMCLQNGPPITSFTAYAEISSPITAASLTAPNIALSATYTCPITTAPCVVESASPAGGATSSTGTSGAGSATANGYHLNAAILRIRGHRLTLRARLTGTTDTPPPARIRVWLEAPGKHRRRLIKTIELSAGLWRTFTAPVHVRAGDHIIITVQADKPVGLTALQTKLLATRRLGAR